MSVTRPQKYSASNTARVTRLGAIASDATSTASRWRPRKQSQITSSWVVVVVVATAAAVSLENRSKGSSPGCWKVIAMIHGSVADCAKITTS
jgi:hypothetical protein